MNLNLYEVLQTCLPNQKLFLQTFKRKKYHQKAKNNHMWTIKHKLQIEIITTRILQSPFQLNASTRIRRESKSKNL